MDTLEKTLTGAAAGIGIATLLPVAGTVGTITLLGAAVSGTIGAVTAVNLDESTECTEESKTIPPENEEDFTNEDQTARSPKKKKKAKTSKTSGDQSVESLKVDESTAALKALVQTKEFKNWMATIPPIDNKPIDNI